MSFCSQLFYTFFLPPGWLSVVFSQLGSNCGFVWIISDGVKAQKKVCIYCLIVFFFTLVVSGGGNNHRNPTSPVSDWAQTGGAVMVGYLSLISSSCVIMFVADNILPSSSYCPSSFVRGRNRDVFCSVPLSNNMIHYCLCYLWEIIHALQVHHRSHMQLPASSLHHKCYNLPSNTEFKGT